MRWRRAVLVLCGLAVWAGPAPAIPRVGDKAPDFKLKGLDGRDYALSGYAGRVVFVSFFGYTCHFCIQDGPYIEQNIHRPFQGQKAFQALGVDVWDGPAADVQKYFVNLTKATYPILLKGSGVGAQYGVDRGTYMVVDSEGVVRYLSPGSLGHRFDETAVVTTLQALLQRVSTGASPMAPDFDGDGVVGLDDFFLFAAAFGGKDQKFDLNQDGSVDLSDFFLFAEAFGKTR